MACVRYPFLISNADERLKMLHFSERLHHLGAAFFCIKITLFAKSLKIKY